MLIRKVRRYLIGHWRGEQGLAWSFWINLVLIRVLLLLLQDWLRPGKGQDFHDMQGFVLLLALLFHGVLFVWQAVGVIRAAELYGRTTGYMAPVWGTQMVLVLAVFWVMTYAFDAWHMTRPAPDNLGRQYAVEAERAEKYSIEPTADGQSLTLSGSLELGIANHLKQQLDAYPDVKQIILASTGGNIYQARGLSNTIRQNGLNTLVVSECSSACTTVFIGGIKRQLSSGGRLGFHQYRIEADYAVLNADPLREQDRDRAIFLQAGVAAWFLDRMFNSPSSDMWYPELPELMEAHVVTDVAP
ncbi:hypothetical protein FF124_07680 [Martelella lutilitoris]|uniref:Uncharacterized protein n=1 Tax=Martelella lutilitoris TaxID=2583532 RepID=A0A5C4JS65_9HYPH|nr:hypothetical protein [Martelella lutilitoris]TNB48208.1 hypothetical protein FF124_07680 [Martelella lutilitoris]